MILRATSTGQAWVKQCAETNRRTTNETHPDPWNGRSPVAGAWPHPWPTPAHAPSTSAWKARPSPAARWTGSVSDMDTNMWLYPRGLERNSNTATPLVWTSKYGSVVTTIYEGAVADGMNEAGLVANMLYLAEVRVSARRSEGDTRPTLPISAWAQYVLDNFATTAEAVEALAPGGVPRRPDRRSHGRGGDRAPVDLRCLGRLRDLRIPRRQAGDPPWPRVPDHDQLADL